MRRRANIRLHREKICLECKSGYLLNGLKTDCLPCSSLDTNCEKCSLNDEKTAVDRCFSCGNGYNVKSDGKGCYTCSDINCLSCSENNFCLNCKPGFTISATGICVQCSVGNCTSCLKESYQTQCSSCHDSFTLSNDKTKCTSCTSFCESCSFVNESRTAGSCNQCSSGFAIDNVNDALCYACNSINENCIECKDRDKTCKTCKSGFVTSLDGLQCISCSSHVTENCLKCSNSNTTRICEECVEGFTLSVDRKTCINCGKIANCKECDNANELNEVKCYKCSTSYSPSVTKAECLSSNPACLSCTFTNLGVECNQCEKGYILKPDKSGCLECPPSCSKCRAVDNFQAHCIRFECTVGHGLSDNEFRCSPCQLNCQKCMKTIFGKSICIKCTDGFTLGPDSKQCFKCPPSCINCVLRGSETFCIASGCKAGYVTKSDGTCGVCGVSCEKCFTAGDGSFKCSKCFPKFTFDSNRNCLPCPFNCKSCSWDSTHFRTICTVCEDGYTYSHRDNKCFKCVSPCLTCYQTETEKLCKSCKSGYFLNQKSKNCLPCPNGCYHCSSVPGNTFGSNCYTCTKGFMLINGQCIECPNNCEKCSSNFGIVRCSSTGCSTGYGLKQSNKLCYKCPKNCQSCYEDKGGLFICTK
ncbi:DgyrCDS14553 [Dimorphilus gyrociliatus]|uniref:DgyrCDS14553 n=1 Tax=Dimorphilus gyrociliatus TaxID=2664684 RepID=A0A7I8WE11_9ANNE|nr:DgyrCDS14553 [Dimorphilus gyrociliatus]